MVSVSGNLSDTQLDHLLTLLTIRGTTGHISFYRGGQEGILYIKDGHVVHAEAGTLRGAQAFLRVAAWNDADFVLDESDEEPPARTISSDIDLLVMESRRQPPQAEPPPVVPQVPAEPPKLTPFAEAQPVMEAAPVQPLLPEPLDTGESIIESIGNDSAEFRTGPLDHLAAVAGVLAAVQVHFSNASTEVQEQIRIAQEAIDRAVELVRADATPAAKPEPQIFDLLPVLPVERIERPASQISAAQLCALLEELAARQYNGYIAWQNAAACGYLVLTGGQIRSAFYRSEKTELHAAAALARLVREVGTGETSVMALDPQIAPPVAALLTVPVKVERNHAPEMSEQHDEAGGIVFRKVDPRIARVQELLLDLRGEKFSGALRVSGNEHSGVILLSNGRSLGLYTSSVPSINTAPLGTIISLLTPIIQSSDALIAIYAVPDAGQPLELDATHE